MDARARKRLVVLVLASLGASCGGESTTSATASAEPAESAASVSAAASEPTGPTYPAEPGIYLERPDGTFEPMTLYTRDPVSWTFTGTEGLQSAAFPSCEAPCGIVIAHMPALDTTTLELAVPRTQPVFGRPPSQHRLRADPEGRRRPITVLSVADGVFRFEIEAEHRVDLVAVLGSHGANGVRAMFLVIHRARGG